MNSSSSSSTSETAAAETQLPSSSSSSPSPPPPPPPHLSLQSPELQAEFLQECRSRFQFHGEGGEVPSSSPLPPSSPLPSPFSPTVVSSPRGSLSSPSSPSSHSRQTRLSLSSPELLSELKDSKSRPLRHVPTHKGFTTVFSGRGRGGVRGGRVSDPGPSIQRTNKNDRH